MKTPEPTAYKKTENFRFIGTKFLFVLGLLYVFPRVQRKIGSAHACVSILLVRVYSLQPVAGGNVVVFVFVYPDYKLLNHDKLRFLCLLFVFACVSFKVGTNFF